MWNPEDRVMPTVAALRLLNKRRDESAAADEDRTFEPITDDGPEEPIGSFELAQKDCPECASLMMISTAVSNFLRGERP